MELYKYLVALVILLLVNKSLARPEQSLADTSTSNFTAVVLSNITDIDMQTDCLNCTDQNSDGVMPSTLATSLLKFGEKRYYIELIFKANWYKAFLYCRYHGMDLVSITSQEENDRLVKQIQDLDRDLFWTSGTDLAEEGTFFWMSNGRPITFKNWLLGEPNNLKSESAQGENCLHLWDINGVGWKWNDAPCETEKNFICEFQ